MQYPHNAAQMGMGFAQQQHPPQLTQQQYMLQQQQQQQQAQHHQPHQQHPQHQQQFAQQQQQQQQQRQQQYLQQQQQQQQQSYPPFDASSAMQIDGTGTTPYDTPHANGTPGTAPLGINGPQTATPGHAHALGGPMGRSPGTAVATHTPPMAPGAVPLPPALRSPPSSAAGTRFVIVLEGTAAVQPLWPDFRGLYIEPLLRAADRQAMGPVEMALVVFRTAEEASGGVESSGWVHSVAEIRHLLDNVRFTGCSYHGAAVTQGLLEAMYLQSLPTCLPQPQQPGSAQGQGQWQQGSGSDRDVIDLTDQRAGPQLDGAGLRPLAPPLCHCVLVAPYDTQRLPVAQLLSRSNGSWRPAREGAPPRREQVWETMDVALCFREQCNMTLSVLGFKDRNALLLQLFCVAFAGEPHFDMQAFAAKYREVLQSCAVPRDKTHLAMLSPLWKQAREELVRERSQQMAQAKAAAANQQAAAAAAAHAAAAANTTAAAAAAAVAAAAAAGQPRPGAGASDNPAGGVAMAAAPGQRPPTGGPPGASPQTNLPPGYTPPVPGPATFVSPSTYTPPPFVNPSPMGPGQTPPIPAPQNGMPQQVPLNHLASSGTKAPAGNGSLYPGSPPAVGLGGVGQPGTGAAPGQLQQPQQPTQQPQQPQQPIGVPGMGATYGQQAGAHGGPGGGNAPGTMQAGGPGRAGGHAPGLPGRMGGLPVPGMVQPGQNPSPGMGNPGMNNAGMGPLAGKVLLPGQQGHGTMGGGPGGYVTAPPGPMGAFGGQQLPHGGPGAGGTGPAGSMPPRAPASAQQQQQQGRAPGLPMPYGGMGAMSGIAPPPQQQQAPPGMPLPGHPGPGPGPGSGGSHPGQGQVHGQHHPGQAPGQQLSTQQQQQQAALANRIPIWEGSLSVSRALLPPSPFNQDPSPLIVFNLSGESSVVPPSLAQSWPPGLVLKSVMNSAVTKVLKDQLKGANMMPTNIGKVHFKVTAHNPDAADAYRYLMDKYGVHRTMLLSDDIPGWVLAMQLRGLDLTQPVPANTELSALLLPSHLIPRTS